MKTEDYESIALDRVREVVAHAHAGNKEIIETGDFVAGVRAALHFIDTKCGKIKLSPTERYCASDVISRVIDAMQFSKESQKYEERGNFIFDCSKSDYAALKRAYKKL